MLPSRAAREQGEEGLHHQRSLRRRKRRQTERRQSVWRQSHQLAPDDPGSDSDNLDTVKAMTLPLARKREIRNQRRGDDVDGGTGTWKTRQVKQWSQTKRKFEEFISALELFRSSLKTIEGHHGTGVAAYFRFVRSLLVLNIVLALLLLTVIMVPQVAMKPGAFSNSLPQVTCINNTNDYFCLAKSCTTDYDSHLDAAKGNRSTGEQILDVLQGTGILENTVLFYGHYFNRTHGVPALGENPRYNMGLAYLCAIGAFFFVSLFVIVYFTGKGVRESLTTNEHSYQQYCNLLFSGWDFCLCKKKPIVRRQVNILREFKVGLQEQERKYKLHNMGTADRCRRIGVRLGINLVVIALLAGAWAAIVFASLKSVELSDAGKHSGVELLLIEYMPSVTITVLNLILPNLFVAIIEKEDYSTETQIRLTLIRTVFLRLTSLGVLIGTLWQKLYGECQGKVLGTVEKCGNCAENVKCWETYIGQQIYRLVLLDFFILVLKTFLYEFPRKVLVTKYPKFFLFKVLGQQEFKIPLQVLDIIYTQTLCWLGAYFCPLIPSITAVKCLIIFFVKKVTVLYNMVPSRSPYRASKSSFFFMTVLLISYLLAVIPIGYIIGNFPPSMHCGPFRVYSQKDYFSFEALYLFIETLPRWLRDTYGVVTSTAVIVPLAVVLCLMIYYYLSVASAYAKMADLHKNQLALEGIDKQYLLNRVKAAVKQIELSEAALT